MLSQAQRSVNPTTMLPRVNMLTNKVIPNLSAETFPDPSSFPIVHATVLQPVRVPVTLTSTSAARIVTRTGIFAPVVPFQSRGTTFYCNLLATTTPTTALLKSQSTKPPVIFPFPLFPITAQSTVHPTTPNAVTVQDLAPLSTNDGFQKSPSFRVETRAIQRRSTAVARVDGSI